MPRWIRRHDDRLGAGAKGLPNNPTGGMASTENLAGRRDSLSGERVYGRLHEGALRLPLLAAGKEIRVGESEAGSPDPCNREDTNRRAARLCQTGDELHGAFGEAPALRGQQQAPWGEGRGIWRFGGA